ncbi:MAG TPA: polysaccharide biosynthesis/export family protein, partial [Candidatus Bathyarchaeia archaeon]|nr:polysaccharide biosynthesis/export family protein [Candidatus Bathyarchaeia archaeon]
MRRSALNAALLLTAVAVAFSVILPAAGAQEPTPDAKKIQAGDVLFLDVYRRPELSSSVQVDGIGAVSVPYVGEIVVLNMTEQE